MFVSRLRALMIGVATLGAAVAVSVVVSGQGGARPSSSETEWRFFGSDAGATRYSPASEIDATNVRTLAWRGGGRRGTSARGPQPLCRLVP